MAGWDARARWYARRLAAMSPAEVLWRARQAAWARLPVRTPSRAARPTEREAELERFRDSVGRPVLLDGVHAQELLRRDPARAASVVEAADRVLERRFSFFGYPEAQLDEPIDWRLDPHSGYQWPRIPAWRIDHRTAPSDPKWIWELNRLQHLPWLAQAWLLTGNRRYADGAFEHLDQWLGQNPPGLGIAWRGAFETGIRAVSIAVAVQGLRDAEGLTLARYERVAELLAVSARHCWRDRSRFSSANNHLVGELAGAAVVMLLFPDLPHAERLRDRAIAGLAAEAGRQILTDGVGAEQAPSYQVFTVELLLVVQVLATRAGLPVPPAIPAAIDRSAEFLTALVGAGDPDPRFGDDDEGFALRLGPEPTRTVRDHLGAVGAATGNHGARWAGRETLWSAWLAVSANGLDRPRVLRGDDGRGSLYAREGGLAVLRDGGRRVTMDVGPLGYLETAAHGHADALALTLSVDGRELIGDPGAGSYYGHPCWRERRRGTLAHATVAIDGQDQSVMGGAFLWMRKAVVLVHRVDLAGGIVDAEHDGYRRLSEPVTHRRWLIAHPGWDEVVVIDRIHGEGGHEARVSWPLHPDVEAGADGVFRIPGGPSMRIASAATVPVLAESTIGDEASGLGWWSHRLESRVPAIHHSVRGAGPLPIVVATVIAASAAEPAAVRDLRLAVDDGAIRLTWRRGGPRSAGGELDADGRRTVSVLAPDATGMVELGRKWGQSPE